MLLGAFLLSVMALCGLIGAAVFAGMGCMLQFLGAAGLMVLFGAMVLCPVSLAQHEACRPARKNRRRAA